MRKWIAGVLLVIAGVLIPGTATAGQQGAQFGAAYQGSSGAYVQWVRMPAPYRGAQSVWCVVADGNSSNGPGGTGAAITCDWSWNIDGSVGGGPTAP